MPTILETDIGEIEMPDEWSAEQIQGWAQTRLPTLREGLKKGAGADLASRVPRDLAVAGGGVVQGLARLPYSIFSSSETSVRTNLRKLGLQAAMAAPLGEEKVIMEAADEAQKRVDQKLIAKAREEQLAKDTIYQLGTQTKQAAEEVYATNPMLDESVLAKLSAAGSSTIPVIAAAPAGPVAMAAVYGALSGQQGAEEAIAAGRPDKADMAYLAYAGLGALSEAALGYPMALIRGIRAARRAGVPPAVFGETVKQSFPQLLGQVAKESAKGTIREAAQEATEQFGQNVAARDVVGFDPTRPLSQGVKEAAIYGGAVGGLFGGGFGTAQALDARRANAPANQIKRLLEAYAIESMDRAETAQADPRLMDIEARRRFLPENAQRTVVPAMLDQPTGGWAVGEDGTRLADLTLTQPNIATETPPEPTPAPRRRSIVPEPERPRFRPPPVTPNVPPATTTPETPVSPPPTTPPVAPPLATSTAGAPAKENLADVGQIGSSIVGNLYQMMFDRLQSGKYPEKIKNPTADRIEAEHKRQPFQSPDEISAWVKTGQRPTPTPSVSTTPGPGQIKRGEVGGMLGSKEVVTTSSGRTTTPFPNVKTDTDRKTTATVKRVDAWLRENAIAEATARGDEFNARIFNASNPKSLSQSDKDSMEEYLFGTQPKVVPSILKPISQPTPATPTPPALTGQPGVVPPAIPEAGKKGETDAVQIGETTPLPAPKTPEDRPKVGTEIRPPQTPQTPGQVEEPQKKADEEAFESELVKRARWQVLNSASPEEAFDRLVQLYEEMPRLGTRTATSKTAQAYSTPPPLAFLGGHLIGIQTGRVVGEPTAGNGMLFIGAHPEATLIGNELDPNRNARLKANFPRAQVSILDATTGDFFDYLSQWKPDRLMMNPPFGGRIEEGGTSNARFPIINAATSKTDTPSIDLAIALNSLEAMAPDGKAVIIIGSKTGTMGPQFGKDSTRAKDYNRPEMLEFFARFNVTDWFTVSGKLYEKMGAGWPVDVIVINGKGATPATEQGGFARPWVKPPKVYNSWAELKEKLYETKTPITSEPTATTEPAAPSGPRPTIRRPSGGATGGTGGPSVRGPGSSGERPTIGTPGVPKEPGTSSADVTPKGLPEREKPQPTDSGPPVVPPRSPEPAPSSPPVPGDAGGTVEKGASVVDLGEGSNLLNVPFKSVSKLGGANLVAPKPLADAMARAVINLEREVGMSVDDYVAHKLGWTKTELAKRFSSAQAEAVALFIRNLESRGTGLINSDQTGVGKGRSVAAAIVYALKNGKIPIFVTAKKQLYTDMAARDLPAVGNTTFVPFITDSEVNWTNGKGDEIKHRKAAGAQREAMQEVARTGQLPSGVHGIFTTYDQLKSDKPQGWNEKPRDKARRKRNFDPRPDGPRLAMLRALAPNAIFILDEAHVAAGMDSEVGLSLQSILPNAAGVYYASATFAKRPDNLSLYALGTAMKKTGLSRTELGNAFNFGGVPLQQALTSMLTESGEFVRREQNMEGVDFKFEATGIDPDKEAELADSYTSFLRDLFQLAEQVNAAATGVVDNENQVRPEEASVDLSNINFGARLFNLSSQYLFSLRSDATIQKAVAALKANQKPFIAVYNTMAGPIADLQDRKLPISFSGMLEREMVKMLEVKINDPLAPEDKKLGLKSGERLLILKPEDLPDGGRFYYQLRDQIRATDFSQMPISPIDTIKAAITKAGYTIGEITGRKGELTEDEEAPRLTKREMQERNKILSDFNHGQLDALIVNSSADTGVSAHTAPDFRDQRQRHGIIAQPNPDINGFMQIVGRIMRFGQTSKPVYTIIASSLATERRFNTMLRAKLNSLNANTTADTESTITRGGLTADIFNEIGDRIVADVMMANPELAQLALIQLPDPSEPESMTDFARVATGKFVLLPNSDAEMLWSEIAETYNTTIKALDDAGENPLKADVVDLRAKTTKSQTIQDGTGKTLFDGPVVLEQADVRPPKPALTSQQAIELAEQGRAEAERKVEEWLSKFDVARQQRLEVMRQRGSTPEQMDAAMANFERTKQAVEESLRFIGETMAVNSAVPDGGVDFYAVPIGLMLKSNTMGDFSGASKHSLVLATNSIRRQITIPLSQLSRLEPANVELFDSERDQSGIRHIITGNLLHGISDALKIARGTAKPKVTIYSTSDQQVKTGILMAPGWRPDVGLRALAKLLKNSAELKAEMDRGKLVTAGPVLIRGNVLSVPSRNEFRSIWGDPQFNRLFRSSPIERRGEFSGELTNYGRDSLYEFLRSKGLSPAVQTVEADPPSPGTRYSVTLNETPGATVGLEEVQNAFPEDQGFEVKPLSITYENGEETRGFLVGLPNGQAILIDSSRNRISFDPTKAAADWGLDPQLVSERGVARGKFVANGVKVGNLSGVGLIELVNTAGPDTLSHEKFHALFEMALTNEDRAAILNRYKTEEKAAEAFRRSEGFTRGFWDKMRQFIERLANLFRGDAFAKLRAPLRADFVSEPQSRTGAKYSLEDVFKSRESLDEFTSRPFISPEEAASLRQQAGARAALVPDAIADEIRALDMADPVEKRMAGILEFVLRMHGLAPALEIRRILADPNLTDELKDASISAVLRAIEHVRIKTVENDDRLKLAEKELAKATKNLTGKVTSERLIEAKAKGTAERLIIGYRAYLTAQAANMPADNNLAAARQQVIQNLETKLNEMTDDLTERENATTRALQAIASRIDELPVAQGPAAVIEAIRSKDILKGVVGESMIDLLTDEKPGGLAPLLMNPETNDLLRQLADIQKKAAEYAKQIEVFEQAFSGTGDPTAVELKKWAETYRKFRNKQQEASKAIAELDKAYREADVSVQVYSRAKDILERLQADPTFQAQHQAVANIPGGHIFNDILDADPLTRTKEYISPLKQEDEKGNIVQNKYRVLLAPDRQADEQTMREMALLVHEIDEFLAEEVTPTERRTWTQLRDYIRKYQLIPMFATTVPGWSFETGHGIIDVNPLTWAQVIAGGRARAPRSEMEKMTMRGADLVNTAFRVADQALNGYRLIRNNREYGDEVTKIAVLEAVKSHDWDYTRISDWNAEVLNPIIASGQGPGQMRLDVGDYIPGSGIKITKEDMRAAKLEKRFSQAIVQTTQGTSKNLPPLLRDNPVLVEDEFTGRKTLRRAFGTGPLTMARRFSQWARTFSLQWSQASQEQRRNLVTDDRGFRFAVLGYVTTTNPEFEIKQPLKAVYEAYTARARTQADQQVQSFDQLLDRLAEIAVAKGIFTDVATAIPQIEQTLLDEIDQVVRAFNKQVADAGHEGNTPQAIVAVASSKNSFTVARHRMVAPDTFYDYTLTSANDRIGFVAGAYQMFQAKQIGALKDLQRALEIEAGKLEERIEGFKKKVGQRRAYSEVQKETEAEQSKGDLRFTYIRLMQHKRTIDKLIDDLSKLVIDVRDPNDAAALLALSRFQSTLSSGLLAGPMAISNNYFGGGVAASYVTMLNLGKARWYLPGKSLGNMAKVMVRRLLASYPSRTLVGNFARSNITAVRYMARKIEEIISHEILFHIEAEAWGLRSPPDMRNRLKAAKELKGTAGQIIFDKTPLISGFFNRLESLPLLRQFLIGLRDLSPRIVDEQINKATAKTFQSELFGWLKVAAVQAFAAREKLAEKTGADISDFTKRDNLLTPEELGLHKSHGHRDITRLRQLFQLVGTLDGFLLDYYKRWKAAPDSEKANVPLFTDSAAEGSVLFDMEAHGNIPTTGFTPPAMAGVGQSGVIKRLIFMFKNYVLRSAAQLERLPEKDLRDPKGWREAYGIWAVLAVLMVFLFAGFLATEVGVPLTKVITGRAPSRVTAANVMADPDAAIVARYVGMALGNNFPYYGKVISEMFGNPGYGSWWDAANLIPIAGLVRDASTAIKRMGQTGDPIFPALDFAGRWMPPLSPVIRLAPGMEGDIAAKNAARALRVVGPSEGMELAGGGGTYAQTPVTPEIRKLLSAAYSGDADGIRKAFAAAVAAKEAMGSPDPVRAVKQSLAAATPARRVFGRSITEAEEQGLIGQMTASQRTAYTGAQNAFSLINRTLGTNYRLTSAPPRTRRTSRRRSLRGRGSRLPTIRRSRVRRRSPFKRTRLAGRRRRRSPSLSFTA